MNNCELVSIIVPVYNVEKYLNRCIDSILDQTYRNVEIIVVDDGSTDASGEICEQYNAIDGRIKVIHKENGGLSDARNAGLREAQGTYVAFIDSDDCIHTEFVERLLSLCKKYGCSISKCGIREFWGDIPPADSLFVDSETMYSAEEYIGTIDVVDGGISVCNKLFCREIFDTISFPVGKLHEDVAVTYRAVALSGQIIETNLVMYYVCHNPDSITRSILKAERLSEIGFRIDMYRFCKEKKWKTAARNHADQLLRVIHRYQVYKMEKSIDDARAYSSKLFQCKVIYFFCVLLREYRTVKEIVGAIRMLM